MLAALDIAIFLKTDDEIGHVAERVFNALGTSYREMTSDEGDTYYLGSGLGFTAELSDFDPYVEYSPLAPFGYELDIISTYWDPDLDAIDIEVTLSEYFARSLAFDLNIETASEVVMGTTEDAEQLRVRVFRRNPQYRLDQAPTTPRVYIVEEHEREVRFDPDAYPDAEDGEDIADGEDETLS